MKSVKMFYLENCPYCKQAFKMLDELMEKEPKYSDVEIEYIDESKNAKMAEAYGYYLVPTFFVDEVKIHEGVPTIEKIEEVLIKATK